MVKPSKKKWIAVSLVAVVCVASGFAYIKWKPNSAAAEQTQSIETVKKGTIRVSVSGTSQLEAKDVQTITTPAEGTIKTMNLTRNQPVKKGDVLLEISNPTLETALEDAKLTLSQLQDDMKDLQSQQSNLVVQAPETGKLTLSGNMGAGSNVQKNGQIGSIADTGTYTVKLPFLVEDAVQLHPGDTVDMSIDGYMLSKSAQVVSVGSDSRPDPSGNRMFDVLFSLANDGSLTSGLKVSATANIGGHSVVSKEKGTLDYANTYPLMSKASGNIKELRVKSGDVVHKGDVIAVIANDTLGDQIKSKQAAIDRQLLSVSDAQQKVDALVIKAPFDGEFSSDFANQKTNVLNNYPVGAPIDAGVALGSVANMSVMQLPIQVDELDLPNIKSGMKAQIRVDSIAGRTFDAEVGQVSTVGTTTNGVTYYQTVLLVNNTDERNPLKYGMTGTGEILIQNKQDVLVLPLTALQQAQGKRYVTLKKPDGTIEEQHEVKIGIRSKTDVEITEGLQEGDQVVVTVPKKTTATQSEQERIRQQFQNGGFGGAGGGNFQGGGRNFGGGNGTGGAGGTGGNGGGAGGQGGGTGGSGGGGGGFGGAGGGAGGGQSSGGSGGGRS